MEIANYDWNFDDTKHRFIIDIRNYESDILPLDITSLTIVILGDEDIDFKLPITFPTSITELNLKFLFRWDALKLRQDLVLKLRDFIIPSSIKTLEIQFEDQKYVISKEVHDVTTTILSTNIKNLKRKLECIGNDETNDVSIFSFIPSTVVELIIPSVDESIIKLIPPTITTLRLRNQECDLDIQQDLTSLIHLDVTNRNTGITIKSIPSSIQTITIGNNIRLACELNRDVQVNYSYFIQQLCEERPYYNELHDEKSFYHAIILYKLRDPTSEPMISNRVKQMFDYRYDVLGYRFEPEDYEGSENIEIKKIEKEKLQSIRDQEKYILPDGIEYLAIGWPYYIDLCNSTLKYLKITNIFEHTSERAITRLQLPKTTTHLELPINSFWCNNFNSIPRTITHLKISGTTRSSGDIHFICVPSTVQYISCSKEFKNTIIIIDEKDYYFTFTPIEAQGDNNINNGIKKLSLIGYGRIDYPLPPTLEELSLGVIGIPWFTKRMPQDLIPHSVKKLRISPDSFLECLPPSLTSIDYNDGVMPEFDSSNIQEVVLTCASSYWYTDCPIKTLTLKPSNGDYSYEISFSKDYEEAPFSRKNYVNHYSFTEINRDIDVDVEDMPAIPIPSTVENLILNNYKISTSSDQNLKKVKLIKNAIIISGLVDSIEVLDVGKSLLELPKQLPKSLKELKLSFKYHHQRIPIQQTNPLTINFIENINNSSSTTTTHNNTTPFLTIWRNKYLKNTILEYSMNPNGDGISELIRKSNKIGHGVLAYDEVGNQNQIPNNTKHLIWNKNEYIQQGVIPYGVISLDLNNFNQAILPNTIPNSVISITMNGFNQDLDNVCFPSKLKYLDLGNEFNQEIKPNRFPATLQFISLNLFKKNIWNTQHLLPSSIDHLAVYGLDNDIGIDQLSDDNTQCSSAFKLHQLSQNDTLFFGSLPKSIKYLKLFNFNSFYSTSHILLGPYIKTIFTSLDIDPNFISIDDRETNHFGVEDADNGSNSNHLSDSQSLIVDESITLHINITENIFIRPNTFFGNNIKSLYFTKEFNQVILSGTIPSSVETLVFGDHYNQPIECNVLPKSLTCLVFGRRFKQPLFNIIPQSVKKLKFKNGYYHKDLLDWIPKSITNLTIGSRIRYDFRHRHREIRFQEANDNCYKLKASSIPSTITKLYIGERQVLDSPKLLPPSITDLTIGNCECYDPIPSNIKNLKVFISEESPHNALQSFLHSYNANYK